MKTSHTKGKTRACWCRCDRPGGNPMVAKSLKITCDEKWSHKGKQKKQATNTPAITYGGLENEAHQIKSHTTTNHKRIHRDKIDTMKKMHTMNPLMQVEEAKIISHTRKILSKDRTTRANMSIDESNVAQNCQK